MENALVVIMISYDLCTINNPTSIFKNKMDEKNITSSIITVKDLIQAFKEDKNNSELKFFNIPLKVKGYVTYVGPDIYGLPSIELSEKEDGKTQMLCVFHLSNYLKFRKINKKQEMTIEGKIIGLYNDSQIVMKNCQILKQ